MALKGTPTRGSPNSITRTSGVRSWLQGEGSVPAHSHEARVIDINLTNWTVDVVTVFDQKRFFDVQVAAPYLHPNFGDGISCMPEIGSKCLVMLPSDGPPPVVIGFIMAMEATTDDGEDIQDAAAQATLSTQPVTPKNASFSGGRPRPKPGDIMLRGRDGNFAILHRGGVLQIGSTPLAQRIYIPLGNLITDISQNYNHFNEAGSINWGIRDVSNDPECEFKQTFRVHANDEFADVRVAVGKVQSPVTEPTGDAGSSSDLAALGIGADVVFEVVLSPGGFDTDAGIPQKNSGKDSKFKFFFDSNGGAMLRAEASVSLRIKKKLRLKVDDTCEIIGKKDVSISAGTKLSLGGGSLVEVGTSGGIVKLNGGSKPVAHVGSIVQGTLTAPVPITVAGSPGTITAGATFTAVVKTGNPTVLV